jgi:hypothetical protein
VLLTRSSVSAHSARIDLSHHVAAKPGRTHLLLGLAAACVVVTLLSLLLAVALGAWWLAYPGVLLTFVGVSWIVPGLLVGMATTESAKRRGRTHADALGVGAGLAVGASALVGWAALLAALGAADKRGLNEGSKAEPPW